jgi:hypothetical protein
MRGEQDPRLFENIAAASFHHGVHAPRPFRRAATDTCISAERVPADQ